MKKKKIALLAVTAALVPTYVILYYVGVSPDGPVHAKERIPFTFGWSPSYSLLPHCALPGKPSASDCNDLLRPFFNPIHQIDRIIRKDLWLTPKEKQEEIDRASQPIIPFAYDMAVVQVLSEPWQNKNYRKANYLDLFEFDNGLRYHSFTNCTTTDWKENYLEISKVLISKAEMLKLDVASLQQALDLILEHSEGRIAYLPVSVSQLYVNKKLTWLIRVEWEYVKYDDPHFFGCTRCFLFDQKTLELLDYQTCI